MISSMGFSSTQISPFRPVCPSYFKLPRSCPSYVSQSLSSPVGLHRFWGKLPSQVIINLQSREEKMILINRNYTAHPGLDVCKDSVTSVPKSWKEETERLLADKRRYNVTASWKAKTERLLADKRENTNIKNEHLEDGNSYSIMHKRIYPNYPWAQINSKELTPFGKDGAYFVKNKDRYPHSLYHNEQTTNGNSNVTAGKMDGWAVDHKRENGWFVRNQAADQIMPKGLYLKNVSRDGLQTNKLKSNGYVAVDDVNGRVVDDKRLNGLSMKNVSKEVHRRTNRSIANKTMEKRKNVDTDTRLSDSDETNEKPDVTDNKSNINDRVTLSQPEMRERLSSIYKNVLVVNNVTLAEGVVHKLTNQYKDHVHACDTEVAKIDVKRETPIDHGEIICFSIYSGPNADFGNGKSCIWVDVLDGGGKDILKKFEPFFKDPSIKKVWHNYSFDNHVIENYGIPLSGFHADTMHMARLWDSSRRTEGGYSLEALTGEKEIMDRVKSCYDQLIGKISMKTIFGKKKVKKDGSEGKLTTIAPVEELQREDREAWISYSALDAISTLQLYESLKGLLSQMKWKLDGKLVDGKNMFHFYEEYWQPFGELLVKMETEGMLVDRAYLAEIEKVAKAEQNIAVNRFRNWASKYSSDAKDMNVGSDTQLRQLLFGGIANSKDPTVTLPESREFKVPNVDKVIEEGKKTATKYRNITLHSIGVELQTEMYTATGWPSVSGDALKTLAGKVSAEYDLVNDDVADDVIMNDPEVMIDNVPETKESSVVGDVDISAYGTALRDFQKVGKKEEGIEACHAIAALCEVCSIDSLISNFILPLQGSNVSGKTGRVHCSLNINTETGRLSARRPNLQNQPALEKDRYKIRQAFIASPGNSLIVADYGQLELRILAHLANCKSMLNAFKAGGDFHSRTAMNMYPHIREAIEQKQVLLEWFPTPGEDKPPVPLLKDAFASERRKAKMLNFSIAYGKTPMGLAHDWKVSVEEARKTVELWYGDRQEVLRWQEARKQEANSVGRVYTLLGRARRFPQTKYMSRAQKGHIERAAINTPVQGSAADVAMCAMLKISKNTQLKELGWKLLLQVHDEVILEGPTETAEIAKAIVVECMSKPFNDGENILKVDLSVDAKCAQNWYAAK